MIKPSNDLVEEVMGNGENKHGSCWQRKMSSTKCLKKKEGFNQVLMTDWKEDPQGLFSKKYIIDNVVVGVFFVKREPPAATNNLELLAWK